MEDVDDGLPGIQNVRINPKQEFDDEDFMYLHDVIVLDTMKELVCSNKENVLNWDVFDNPSSRRKRILIMVQELRIVFSMQVPCMVILMLMSIMF